MIELNDLSKWIYYTGLFLSDFDKKKNESEIHNLVFRDFLFRNGFKQETSFLLWNQGTTLMLLYGLFVLPKEFWTRFLSEDIGNQNLKTQADKLIFDTFNFKTRSHFVDCENTTSSKLDKETFLRRLRNAISHSRIEIIKGNQGEIKFSNKADDGAINFCVKISPIQLTAFLNEISIFFIDNLK